MFCIVSDESCRRYVVPLAKREAWYEEFHGSEEYHLGDLPRWARALDGEESICFPSYQLIRERTPEDEIGNADLDDGC